MCRADFMAAAATDAGTAVQMRSRAVGAERDGVDRAGGHTFAATNTRLAEIGAKPDQFTDQPDHVAR